MMSNPLYQPLLGHKGAELLHTLQLDRDNAVVVVRECATPCCCHHRCRCHTAFMEAPSPSHPPPRRDCLTCRHVSELNVRFKDSYSMSLRRMNLRTKQPVLSLSNFGRVAVQRLPKRAVHLMHHAHPQCSCLPKAPALPWICTLPLQVACVLLCSHPQSALNSSERGGVI